MPEEEKEKVPRPNPREYAYCPTCSKAEGSAVYYHRSQVEFDEGWWGDEGGWRCPHGHPVLARWEHGEKKA